MGYWEKRREKEMYAAMASAEKTSQDIANIYAKASRDLNYRIQKVYERYKDRFNLSDKEALYLLNDLKNPSDINELKSKLQGMKKTSPAAQELIKELDAPGYRKRIERFENLQRDIDSIMDTVYQQEKTVSTIHYIEQYGKSYYREIFDLKRKIGLDFSFSFADPKELNRILASGWSGENYSSRIWSNTKTLAKDLKEQMALSYLTGKSEKDIVTDITKKYAQGAFNARRLVRTESAYICGQATASADMAAGIEQYRILATLDLRTSEKCRGMDGKEFDYKDMEVGINYPPFHPFCRTTTISVLDDQNLAELQRTSRDPVTGEVKRFPANTTYKDWYQTEIKGNPDGEFAEKVEKNRSKDILEYSKYAEVLGKSTIGSITSFRELKYKEPEKMELYQKDYSRQIQAIKHPDLTVPAPNEIEILDDSLELFGEDKKRFQRMIKKKLTKYPAEASKSKDGILYKQNMILYDKDKNPIEVKIKWEYDIKPNKIKLIDIAQ